MTRAAELKDRLYDIGGIVATCIITLPIVAFIAFAAFNPEIIRWTP